MKSLAAALQATKHVYAADIGEFHFRFAFGGPSYISSRQTMEPLPPLDETLLPPGIYRHYKGNDYQVIGLARHSETREAVVVYRALYGERGLWVRPLAMFLETVEVAGARVPRFAFKNP